jgi:uncharacterized delta-60 repeat protein
MLSYLMRAVVLAAVTMSGIPVSHARPGDVDPGFGQHGVVRSPGRLNSLPDGTLIGVVTTPGSNSVMVSHWDINGVPDPGFGVGGSIQIAVPIVTFPGMATRTSDGKFYIWGALQEIHQNYALHDMAILRLNADGNLDQSFGTGGVLTRPSAPYAVGDPGYGEVVANLIVEPDGHLLVCDAEFEDFPYAFTSNSVTIRKFDHSGAVDPTFGAGTGATLLPGDVSVLPFFTSFSLTGTGLIRLVSTVPSFVYLKADGSPAPSPVNYADLRSDVAAWRFAGDLANGDTLVVGESDAGAVVVARVHADGTPESSFGGSGTGFAEFPGRTLVSPYYAAESTFLSTDGHRLYVSLSPATAGDGGMALLRLSTDGPAAGTPDHTFGVDGSVELNALTLQVDGVVEQADGAVLVTTYFESAFRLLATNTASPGFIGVGAVSGNLAGTLTLFVAPTTAYVSVSRFAGREGAISVKYSTANIDAVSGVNYRATSGMLTWADGDVSDKTIAIDLLADQGGSPDGYKTFSLNLVPVEGGALAFSPETDLSVVVPEGVIQQTTPPESASAASPAGPVSGGGGAVSVELLGLLTVALLAGRVRIRLPKLQWSR